MTEFGLPKVLKSLIREKTLNVDFDKDILKEEAFLTKGNLTVLCKFHSGDNQSHNS